MSEATILRANRNVKQFTLVDSQGDSVINDDSVQVTQLKSSTATAPAQTAVSTTEGQILAANTLRKRFMVQNTGATVIKLVLGAGTVTQTAYHIALLAGGAADDGTGASYLDETWTGAVRAISSAVGGTIVITELT